MPRFVRATEPGGKVHWINLAHVRHLTVETGKAGSPVTTAVHIDNWWVERKLSVVETPEELLGQQDDLR